MSCETYLSISISLYPRLYLFTIQHVHKIADWFKGSAKVRM